jgi:predicted secreted protein
MDWFSSIIVFLLIWWISLFTVLPWGVRHDEKEGTGAPVHTHMKRKILATSLLSAILWGVVYVLIEIEIISFYDLSVDMARADGVNK